MLGLDLAVVDESLGGEYRERGRNVGDMSAVSHLDVSDVGERVDADLRSGGKQDLAVVDEVACRSVGSEVDGHVSVGAVLADAESDLERSVVGERAGDLHGREI